LSEAHDGPAYYILFLQGKLLALELLVKVLQNPQHTWSCVRDEFARHLRQPICITLLRNCSATDAAAFQLAIKLLVAVMSKLKLRRVLKVGLMAGGSNVQAQAQEGVEGRIDGWWQ
jgi:hypothetical protein